MPGRHIRKMGEYKSCIVSKVAGGLTSGMTFGAKEITGLLLCSRNKVNMVFK